jgi:hypothetical protein
MSDKHEPQFKVLATPAGTGSRVLFRGQEIEDVGAVEVSTRVGVDQITVTRITIELPMQSVEVEAIPQPDPFRQYRDMIRGGSATGY